jgi:hypothetical protein
MSVCNYCNQDKDSKEFYRGYAHVCKTCKKQYRRDKYEQDPSPDLEQANLWHKQNVEQTKANNSRWQATHPVHKANYNHQRRSMTQDFVSIEDWQALLEKHNHQCLSCHTTNIPLTQDHVIPLSKGGKHHIDNLQPLCQSCNSKKRDKVIDYR